MDDDIRFDDVPDGCGCTEIWEYLSERREQQTETEQETDEPSTA